MEYEDDDLRWHRQIADNPFGTKVIPAWRPDKAMAIESPQAYISYIEKLGEAAGMEIRSYADLMEALQKRHDFFESMGCRLSDHGLETFYAADYSEDEIERIFSKVMSGKEADAAELEKFRSACLHDFAVMDAESGWAQQFHIGAIRNNNTRMYMQLGPDTGYDAIHDVQCAAAGHRFFDRLTLEGKLAKTILYCLNPKDNEAVMGRQRFYVNGQLVREHEGGYLPVTINLTEAGVKPGDNVVVAVMADNSDDKTYPPGKKQMTLDFCYHGGIYRDVWMRQRPQVYITDAVEENRTAAGGIFVHYADISQKSAGVYVNTDIRNGLSVPSRVTVTNILTDAAGRIVKKWVKKSVVPAHGFITLTQGSTISHPQLWSPEHPYLYTLQTTVSSAAGVDKATTRIGIRSFEFRGKEGFWLNGSRYRQFVGANRHQDFAYVGNAVPNSQQWRDARRHDPLPHHLREDPGVLLQGPYDRRS